MAEKLVKVKARGVNISALKECETSSHWGVIFTRIKDEIVAELPKIEAEIMIDTRRVDAV